MVWRSGTDAGRTGAKRLSPSAVILGTGMSQNVSRARRHSGTYVPIAGAKFTQSLMTPVPPSGVLFLLQAGYPVRLVLGMCVRTINDLDNRSVDPMWAQEPDPQFERLVDLLEGMQRAGGLSMRVEQRDDGDAVVMTLRRKRVSEQDANEVAEILGVSPDAAEYRITYGAVAKSNRDGCGSFETTPRHDDSMGWEWSRRSAASWSTYPHSCGLV